MLWVVLEVVDGDMYDKALGEGEALHSDVLRALTTGPAEMHTSQQRRVCQGATQIFKLVCTRHCTMTKWLLVVMELMILFQDIHLYTITNHYRNN